jgi:hypothetical protein
MSESTHQSRDRGEGLRVRAWNLVLLIPLLMLVVPWFNSLEPRLFGMPFLYWVQFAWVAVGVACVAIVYVTTRDPNEPVAPGAPIDVDDLDEGNLR